jgi:lipoate-protein ligase A
MPLTFPRRFIQTGRVDTWRLLIDPPGPAGYNMAVDEALAESCRTGATGPTLRLYGWDRPSISLGYFQRAHEVVDLDRCREGRVPVVRRTTGGRAVHHHHEVTYSVVSPIPHPLFPPTIRGTYEVVARALAAGLSTLGLRVELYPRDPERPRRGIGSPLCFGSTSRYELTLGGKKVIGSAQRRWKTAFLQHGSILLAHDPAETAPWFQGAPSDPESITGLNADERGLTPDDIHWALITAWEHTLGIRLLPGSLSPEEAALVAETSRSRDLTVTVVV